MRTRKQELVWQSALMECTHKIQRELVYINALMELILMEIAVLLFLFVCICVLMGYLLIHIP